MKKYILSLFLILSMNMSPESKPLHEELAATKAQKSDARRAEEVAEARNKVEDLYGIAERALAEADKALAAEKALAEEGDPRIAIMAAATKAQKADARRAEEVAEARNKVEDLYGIAERALAAADKALAAAKAAEARAEKAREAQKAGEAEKAKAEERISSRNKQNKNCCSIS